MEILFEIIFEVYAELMMLIVPEKNVTKAHKIISAVISLIVLVGVLALALFGVALIIDEGNLLGILPLSFALIISVLQIGLGIFLYNKNH